LERKDDEFSASKDGKSRWSLREATDHVSPDFAGAWLWAEG